MTARRTEDLRDEPRSETLRPLAVSEQVPHELALELEADAREAALAPDSQGAQMFGDGVV